MIQKLKHTAKSVRAGERSALTRVFEEGVLNKNRRDCQR